MTQIRSFKDLGISPPISRSFIGDKIAVKKIIGKSIIVHDYKLVPSNFKGNRLDLQITYNDDKRVVFTSSTYLIETIEKVPKEAFPFSTIIIEENDAYNFN